MKNAILKNKEDLVKRISSFDNLIKEFMSTDFVLTEENIINFLNKLHNLDYTLSYSHLYTIKTINDIIVGGYFNVNNKELGISVNAILNLDKNVPSAVIERYKITILCNYFHESRHEEQLNESISVLNGRNDSAYSKMICVEIFGSIPYEPINSLREIDARLVAIQRFLELEKRNVYKFNPLSCHFVMEQLVQMLDGINLIDGQKDIYSKEPFDCTKFIVNKLKCYTDLKSDGFNVKIHSATFVRKFIIDYYTKFSSLISGDYEYIIKKLFLDSQVLFTTKLELQNKYKLDFSQKNIWDNFIKFLCRQPLRVALYELMYDRKLITKDINDLTVYKKEVEEYFKEKGQEYTRELDNEFTKDFKEHKEFEKWLRNKRKKEFEAELTETENQK